VSHIYLTVARYFRAVQHLTFTRIDGESNDLPWEFTMHHYPTILFSPAHRYLTVTVYFRLSVNNDVKFLTLWKKIKKVKKEGKAIPVSGHGGP
jgi:hypothetical protein